MVLFIYCECIGCNGFKDFRLEALNMKHALKSPYVWFMKYTKFDNFLKVIVSVVHFILRDDFSLH